jgi:hypothetical protein
MSYRSALSNPTLSSGNVGQVILGNITSGGGLQSGIPQSIDNINLPAGVWNIQMSSSFNIACNPTSVNIALITPTLFNYFVASVVPIQSVTPAQQVLYSNMVTISLDAPTSLSLLVSATFTGGTLTVTIPSTSAGRFIVATKMA